MYYYVGLNKMCIFICEYVGSLLGLKIVPYENSKKKSINDFSKNHKCWTT